MEGLSWAERIAAATKPVPSTSINTTTTTSTPIIEPKVIPPKEEQDNALQEAIYSSLKMTSSSTPVVNNTNSSKTVTYPFMPKQPLQQEIDKCMSMEQVSNFKLRGLHNTINTCYMNAILQTFVFLPPFWNISQQIRQQFPNFSSFPWTNAWIQFIQQFPLTKPNSTAIEFSSPFVPQTIVSCLKQNPFMEQHFGSQQDVHEFMVYFLDQLHEEMKWKQPIAEEQEDTKGWKEVGKNNRSSKINEIKMEWVSYISALFEGKLRSWVKQKNKKAVLTLQPFYSLDLPILQESNSGTISHIKDAFTNLTQKEHMSDISAKREVSIETPPKILTLQLKRFLFTSDQKQVIKLSDFIAYDAQMELQDPLVPFSKIPIHDYRRKYTLFSVVVHHGKDASSGHYSTFVRHIPSNQWVHIDDTRVTIVKESDALKQQAYLLFYVQQRSK